MHLLLAMISFVTTSVLSISSPAFSNGGYIPAKYTCDGTGVNPPIQISNIPPGTESLVLIVDDPDAPNGTFDHWLVWNIPPMRNIQENSVPGTEGRNGTGNNGYKGPCPPSGTHHYHFRIYALGSRLDLKSGSGKTSLEQAMKSQIIASAELIGLYQKKMK